MISPNVTLLTKADGMKSTQKILSQDQITAFYHELFVENEVDDFVALSDFSVTPSLDNIVDMGGGCVFFAKALQNRIHLKVKVLDSDSQSIDFCKQEGIDATYGDALKPTIVGDESIVCFNLILHSLGLLLRS